MHVRIACQQLGSMPFGLSPLRVPMEYHQLLIGVGIRNRVVVARCTYLEGTTLALSCNQSNTLHEVERQLCIAE